MSPDGERCSVIWLGGEHDSATRPQLRSAFDEAALDEDGDIAVDLSGITFMDASTIGVLIDVRNRLRARSDSLYLRAPSRWARRVLDLCGLAQLIDEPAAGEDPRAGALQTWVAVPATAGTSRAPETTVANGAPPAADASARQRLPEPVGIARQGRATT